MLHDPAPLSPQHPAQFWMTRQQATQALLEAGLLSPDKALALDCLFNEVATGARPPIPPSHPLVPEIKAVFLMQLRPANLHRH